MPFLGGFYSGEHFFLGIQEQKESLLLLTKAVRFQNEEISVPIRALFLPSSAEE